MGVGSREAEITRVHVCGFIVTCGDGSSDRALAHPIPPQRARWSGRGSRYAGLWAQIGPRLEALRLRPTLLRKHASMACGFRKRRAEGSKLAVIFPLLFFFFFCWSIEPRPEDYHSFAFLDSRWDWSLSRGLNAWEEVLAFPSLLLRALPPLVSADEANPGRGWSDLTGTRVAG